MKKIDFLKTIAFGLFLICGLSACQEDDGDIKVSAIAVKEATYVSPKMQLTLKDNATLQLTPYIMPQNATNQKVSYSNKYPDLMSVNENGLITAKAIGTDTVTLTATDGSGTKVSYPVIISDHKVKATGINVGATGSNILLKIGGAAFDLSTHVSIVPADTWDKSVTYASVDESIAKVSPAGLVTPVKVGTTIIRITTADGSNITRDCNVTVQDQVKREVDLNRSAWTVTTQTASGYDYVRDGWSATLSAFTTGQPEHLFDDNTGTYLSILKPGKTYSPGNGADRIPLSGNEPTEPLPSFTVDMKSPQTFDYFKWQHRNGANPAGGSNTYNYLRVYGVSIAGSNDGSTFTNIKTNIEIPNKSGFVGGASAADDTIYLLELPESTYRYIKVTIVMWSDIYPGGAASGSSMQVSEFKLGKIVLE